MAVQYFGKFSDCFLVKGVKRGIIYDLTRKKHDLIPLSLIDFVNSIENKPITIIEEFKKKYDAKIIDEYLSFLMDKEYLFTATKDELKLFIPMQNNWDIPSVFSNAIIELGVLDFEKIKVMISKLEEVNCCHLQFFYFSKIKTDELELFADLFSNTRIKSVELYIDYSVEYESYSWDDFLVSNKRIKSVISSNSPKLSHKVHGKYGMGNIIYLPIEVDLPINKSNSHPNYLNVNIDLFFENLNYNSFFYKKVFIDRDFQIIKDFVNRESFGSILDTDLKKLSKNKDYTEYWTVRKDDIKECQKCEFRYMCIDQRTPIKKGKYWGFDTKCNYNPNTLEWNNYS